MSIETSQIKMNNDENRTANRINRMRNWSAGEVAADDVADRWWSLKMFCEDGRHAFKSTMHTTNALSFNCQKAKQGTRSVHRGFFFCMGKSSKNPLSTSTYRSRDQPVWEPPHHLFSGCLPSLRLRVHCAPNGILHCRLPCWTPVDHVNAAVVILLNKQRLDHKPFPAQCFAASTHEKGLGVNESDGNVERWVCRETFVNLPDLVVDAGGGHVTERGGIHDNKTPATPVLKPRNDGREVWLKFSDRLIPCGPTTLIIPLELSPLHVQHVIGANGKDNPTVSGQVWVWGSDGIEKIRWSPAGADELRMRSDLSQRPRTLTWARSEDPALESTWEIRGPRKKPAPRAKTFGSFGCFDSEELTWWSVTVCVCIAQSMLWACEESHLQSGIPCTCAAVFYTKSHTCGSAAKMKTGELFTCYSPFSFLRALFSCRSVDFWEIKFYS